VQKEVALASLAAPSPTGDKIIPDMAYLTIPQALRATDF
jgi:hypothetical protein